MWAKAKKGISMQMRRLLRPADTCSGSVYGPSLAMTPAATRMEIPMDCQKEKNKIPLTQRNFGTGLCVKLILTPYKRGGKNIPEGLQVIIDTDPKHRQAV